MRVYCIIITYNGIQWIKSCLENLIGSSMKCHIVLIDNGSIDGTTDLIKTNFPGIELIENELNVGFGQANNLGLKSALKANADFVFLLNQDAYVENTTLEMLIKVSMANEDYGIISPIHLNGQGDALDYKFTNYIFRNKQLLYDALKNHYSSLIYEVPFVNAAAWLITKKVISEIGGFDPIFYHYGEDANFCQRAIFHGFKIGIVPTAFVKHDRETRIKTKHELFSKGYFDNYLIELKCKYADITLRKSTENVKYEKKKIIKLFIKSLMKLNILVPLKYVKQYNLIKKTFKVIFESRDITSEKGSHYLN